MKLLSALVLLFSTPNLQSGNDTIRVTLLQADSIFLKTNYYLLASAMNIEASKAQILQAKLYPNPVFTAEFNAYDPQNDIIFHTGPTGQKSFQFQQLVLLGGKRSSEIEMAKTNAAIAELEFQQLVRELKFKLHSQLFSVAQLLFLLNKQNHQLDLLDTLLSAYKIQTDKGNLPVKDFVRLKGTYLKLNNNRAELYRMLYTIQSDLQKLLNIHGFIRFSFEEKELEAYIRNTAMDQLISEALLNRPEMLIMHNNNVLAQQYLRYQKSQAVPDLNIYTAYDQRGGAFVNQWNAGVSLPLPLWNRNQGNIAMSRYKIKESEFNLASVQNEITSDIENSYALYSHSVSEYLKSKQLYNQEFETTVEGMTENFQKRNVSIIEFVDFFEAYNDVLSELVRTRIQLVEMAERLNLLVGKDIY
ncbi:MAG TPA: TolC family protein [Bacteroidia bacterium]|nr:TolC family protein [Bacteroidia bacterium]